MILIVLMYWLELMPLNWSKLIQDKHATMMLSLLLISIVSAERWISRGDTDEQSLVYSVNRSFRQSWWDLMIYDEEPPEIYEELEDLETMWNVKRWFTYHLKVLKVTKLSRDHLLNILLWFDRLEDEATQLFLFNVTDFDWNHDGKLGLDESHALNYLMMNEYRNVDGDSRNTFKLWNIRFQRAHYGQKETTLSDQQVIKYFKPHQFTSMAYASAEEWLLSFDSDRDDFVSRHEFEDLVTNNPYYAADKNLMVEQFNKFDTGYDTDYKNNVVSWQEVFDYYQANASLENKLNTIVDKALKVCDLDGNNEIDRHEIKNIDCWEELNMSRLTFYGRFVDFGMHLRMDSPCKEEKVTNCKEYRTVSAADLSLFNYPLYLSREQVKTAISNMRDGQYKYKIN